jgi:dihydroorotate dehydrogenase (NAD+) catalytic subunit
MKPDTTIQLCTIEVRNPLILAAGVLGISSETMKRVVDSGAGAVITKSVGVKPRKGHPGPNVVEVESGLLNAMGLPNPGIEQMSAEIAKLAKSGIRTFASVYGFSPEEYATAAQSACSAGALAVELNVSCPNVADVGFEIGQSTKMVAEVTEAVKAKVDRPVIVKLSPNVTDLVEIGKAAERSGADGVTAVNTLRGMAIDVETRMPVLGAGRGGLSGPVIKPVALRCVYELYDSLRIPIIGCGGITSWKDAVEFILAGATALQIGTALMYKDLSVFREINRGMTSYMKRNGFGRIEEMRGSAHKR